LCPRPAGTPRRFDGVAFRGRLGLGWCQPLRDVRFGMFGVAAIPFREDAGGCQANGARRSASGCFGSQPPPPTPPHRRGGDLRRGARCGRRGRPSGWRRPPSGSRGQGPPGGLERKRRGLVTGGSLCRMGWTKGGRGLDGSEGGSGSGSDASHGDAPPTASRGLRWSVAYPGPGGGASEGGGSRTPT